MRSLVACCTCAVALALLGGCRQGELSGRTDDARHEEILRAGVHDYPAARHGGVVLRAGVDAVEVVVEPGGRVRVYPRDGGGVESDARGRIGPYGTVTMRPQDGQSVSAVLAADPNGGELFAQLPAPAAATTEYQFDVSFRGRPVQTGVSVLPGGTETTLQVARAAGDAPVIPSQSMGAPVTVTDGASATPPSAVGGGPR